MRKEPIKLFDSVALLKDLQEHELVFGQAGTVVEFLKNDVFEVEFANKKGETIAEIALKAEDLMLLHCEKEATS